jgi:hypothetical protein
LTVNNGKDKDHEEKPAGWLDRQLPKILIASAVFCALALLGRALTG